MNILLTNDDGFQSLGLQQMCRGLSDAGHNIFVVAPDGQRSAFSHTVNFNKNIKFTLLEDYFGAVKAYTCSGSPSDCVKFAVLRLNVEIDIVVSGPNDGENYGFDVLYSGTVGAAEEALICGLKAVAVSRLNFGGDFSQCVDYIVNNIETLAKFRHRDVLININVPDRPTSEIKGVVVVPQGRNYYKDTYIDASEGLWRLEGVKLHSETELSDVTLTNEGYITLTPITICQTHRESIDVLKELLKK